MDISIRTASDNDLTAIKELDQECFPAGSIDFEPAAKGEIERGISAQSVFVAEVDGKVVGFLQLEKELGSRWELLALAVTSEFRSKSIGTRLMNRLMEEIAKSKHFPGISVVTNPTNQKMHDLLKRYSFWEAEYLLDYYGPKKDRIRFDLEN
jgi:ribosomal protein S18 acetylase RimI-like enzyme